MNPARRGWIFIAVALGAAAVPCPAGGQARIDPWRDAPAAFVPPRLHPDGNAFETRELAPGVYALLATRPGVTNSGFVVGSAGVLVVDSHLSDAMADSILAAVRRVTPLPVLWLVNTNYHGDHTFGNARFPGQTRIVAHRETARIMRDREREVAVMLPLARHDTALLRSARLRLPDVLVDSLLVLDLGGRTVELHHFGPANSAGDLFVFDPVNGILFSGNAVALPLPLLFEFGARAVLPTYERLLGRLAVRTVIGGHLRFHDPAIIAGYVAYLREVAAAVESGIAAGRREAEVLALPLGEARLRVAEGNAWFRSFLLGLHAFAVSLTYREAIP